MRVEVYFHAGESLPAFVVEGEIAEKLQQAFGTGWSAIPAQALAEALEYDGESDLARRVSALNEAKITVFIAPR